MAGLLVCGSIALDDLEGPFGRVEDELGGSAIYFALAASLIRPVSVCAPVGRSDAQRIHEVTAGRSIDLALLGVADAPTYHWSARQQRGSNLDLGSRDSIYDVWEPQPPAGFEGWAFVGSMRPDRQALAAARLEEAALLAGDSMRSYLRGRPPAASQLLEACDWFFANEEELAALGGDVRRAADFRSASELSGLVVKAGARGCTAWTPAGALHVPALTERPVLDVTGAGDALAGGFLARWLETGGQPEGLADALVYGVACASIAISDIGVRGLGQATADQLEERVGEVWACLNGESARRS
ncbi:MAG: hypothetical protein E6I70_08705 [Chloroflexi bacterium]|nr:MAG: hypothetical protein E6I70_08705 [Chloroflexota bacterium]